jgi:hypothetical protein
MLYYIILCVLRLRPARPVPKIHTLYDSMKCHTYFMYTYMHTYIYVVSYILHIYIYSVIHTSYRCQRTVIRSAYPARPGAWVGFILLPGDGVPWCVCARACACACVCVCACARARARACVLFSLPSLPFSPSPLPPPRLSLPPARPG